MELEGRRLRRRRYELGLSLEQVAERVEISFSSLAKMERNIIGARPATAHKLSKVLDLPMHEFVVELATDKAA